MIELMVEHGIQWSDVHPPHALFRCSLTCHLLSVLLWTLHLFRNKILSLRLGDDLPRCVLVQAQALIVSLLAKTYLSLINHLFYVHYKLLSSVLTVNQLADAQTKADLSWFCKTSQIQILTQPVLLLSGLTATAPISGWVGHGYKCWYLK